MLIKKENLNMSEQINAKKIALSNMLDRIEDIVIDTNQLGYRLANDANMVNLWFDNLIKLWGELNPLLKPGGSHEWRVIGEPENGFGDVVSYDSMGIKDPRYWDTKQGNRLSPYVFKLLRRAMMQGEHQDNSMVPRLGEFRKHVNTFLAKTPYQDTAPTIEATHASLAADKITILKHLNELEGILLRYRQIGESSAIDRSKVFHHQGALLAASIKLSQNLAYVSEDERDVEMSEILRNLEGAGGGFWDIRFITHAPDGRTVMVSSTAFHLTREAVIDVIDQRPDINYLLTALVKVVEKEIWG